MARRVEQHPQPLLWLVLGDGLWLYNVDSRGRVVNASFTGSRWGDLELPVPEPPMAFRLLPYPRYRPEMHRLVSGTWLWSNWSVHLARSQVPCGVVCRFPLGRLFRWRPRIGLKPVGIERLHVEHVGCPGVRRGAPADVKNGAGLVPQDVQRTCRHPGHNSACVAHRVRQPGQTRC